MVSPQIIQYAHDDRIRCFVDTEFYEDGNTIDLISIGAVRSDGEEFYAINREAKLHLVSPWVRENVLRQLPPYGDVAWKTRQQIAQSFSIFLAVGYYEPRRPAVSEVWSYYADYDWVAICQLYGTMMGLPNHFPMYCLDLKQLSIMLGSPKHPKQESGEHNALDDARYHRDLYAFLRGIQTGVALQLAEEERQALLLALAHLAIERPGWDDMLNRIALKIDNDLGGRAGMYDEFKALNTSRITPVNVSGEPE